MEDRTSLDDCMHRAVLHLQRGATAEGDTRATELRAVAEALVDARVAHDGDWKGRTHAYKQWVAEVYALANIPLAERQRLQASIAYHISSVLHERLTPKQLTELGFHTKSLRDRRDVRRDRVTSMANLLKESEPITRASDVKRAHDAILRLYSRLSSENQARVLLDVVARDTHTPMPGVRVLIDNDGMTK